MKCENEVCIYYRKGKCTRDKVTIDYFAMCKEFVSKIPDEQITIKTDFEVKNGGE